MRALRAARSGSDPRRWVPAQAYDERQEWTVVINDGFAIAYDAPADRWPTLYGAEEGCCRNSPLNRVHHSVDYDPVNGRLVVYGGTYGTEGGLVKADDVWAFDVETGEWLQPLAQSEPSGRTTG